MHRFCSAPPSLAQELDVGPAQTEAQTHLHLSITSTRQTGCNVQPLLMHVYKDYRQTLSNNAAILQPVDV